MKIFSKSISLLTALLMLLGMMTVAPFSVSAADSPKQISAVEDNGENNNDSDYDEDDEPPRHLERAVHVIDVLKHHCREGKSEIEAVDLL